MGVALNGFLPANLGTFVTLLMFVTIIPSCTFAGALGAYVVQKIFFTIIGTFIYLYMFLSVPGAFDVSFGNLTSHPGSTIGIIVGAILLLYFLVRVFWQGSRQSEARLGPGEGRRRDPCRAEGLPPQLVPALVPLVVLQDGRDRDLPRRLRDPGDVRVGDLGLRLRIAGKHGVVHARLVGVTQATNALALETCCNVPYDQAIDYSTAQQLIMTAWNQVVALVLVVLVFGWTGGKQLVGQSYEDAKVRSAQMKEERAEKKAVKKTEKQHRKAEEKAEKERQKAEKRAART